MEATASEWELAADENVDAFWGSSEAPPDPLQGMKARIGILGKNQVGTF